MSLRLLKLLPVTVNEVSVPEVLRRWKLLCAFPLNVAVRDRHRPGRADRVAGELAELDALVTRAVAVVRDVAAGEGEVRDADPLDAGVATALNVHVAEAHVGGRGQVDADPGGVLDDAAGAVARPRLRPRSP